MADSSVAKIPGAASQRGNLYLPIKIKMSFLALPFIFFSFAIQLNAQELATTPNTQGITAGIKNLTESLDLLTAIKNSKKPIDTISLQTALNAAINLSDEEIKNLHNGLEELENLTNDKETTRAKYLNQLADFRTTLTEAKDEVNRDASMHDIIKTAQAVKDWRDTIYIPAIRPIVDFMAVIHSKNAVIIAHTRLISIVKDEKKIRGFLVGGKTSTFLKHLKKVQSEISQATQLNMQAEKLLISPAGAPDNGDTIDAIIANANRLINAAYDGFLAMSKLVKK